MGLDRAIDITAEQRKTVLALLERHLPNTTAWVYGSRAQWAARSQSDLDMVVFATPEQNSRVSDLREAFEESGLLFRADLLVWDAVPEQFRKHIKRDHVVMVEREERDVAGEWRDMPFSDALLINPPVLLERGKTYPFVDMAAVNAGSRCAHAVEQRKYSGGGSRFRTGDTLMARITPCLENGKIARYCALDASGTAHGSTEFIVIRGHANVTDTEFGYYLTKCEEVRSYAVGQMTGTSGRQRVPTESLNHLTVLVPPLPEQRAIAHILGTLDDKIELNRRMNQTLEAMARALFKSWFVDFDPVRAKMAGRDPGLPKHLADLFPDRLVDSELGEIPEGWEVGSFSDVVTQLQDKENPVTSPATVFSHFSIPAYDEGQTPKQQLGESIKSPKSRVQPDVVLLSKLNPEIERVWLVDVVSDDRAICSTEFLVLQARPPFQQSYVYCLSRSPLFRQQVKSLVTGTSKSHQRAQAGAVLALEAIIPSAPVIRAFDQQVSALLDRSLGGHRETTILTALRDTLLPKLISGKLRVKDAERIVEIA